MENEGSFFHWTAGAAAALCVWRVVHFASGHHESRFS